MKLFFNLMKVLKLKNSNNKIFSNQIFKNYDDNNFDSTYNYNSISTVYVNNENIMNNNIIPSNKSQNINNQLNKLNNLFLLDCYSNHSLCNI